MTKNSKISTLLIKNMKDWAINSDKFRDINYLFAPCYYLFGKVRDKNKQSAKAITKMLTEYARLVEQQGSPNQRSLLGDTQTATVNDLLDNAIANSTPAQSAKSETLWQEGNATAFDNIERAYNDAANEYYGLVPVSEIRKRIPEGERAALAENLKQMQRDKELTLNVQGNPGRLSAEDRANPVMVNGDPRHVVYMEKPRQSKQQAQPQPKPAKKEYANLTERVTDEIMSANIPGMTREKAEANAAIVNARGETIAPMIGLTPEQWYERLGIRWEYGGDTENRGDIYQQAMRDGVDLDLRVPVLPFAGQFATRKELVNWLSQLVETGGMITRDAMAIIDVGGKHKIKHVAMSSHQNDNSSHSVKKARDTSVLNLGDLIKSSVLVESEPNHDPGKQHVKAYHRFYVPIETNDGVYTVRIVTEEATNSDGKTPLLLNSYDVMIDKESPALRDTLTKNGGTVLSGMNERPNEITIRDMLRGVKDTHCLIKNNPEMGIVSS